MRVAFLHFHLKTGGVTSVIARQAEAVQAFGGDALILSGESAAGPTGCEVIEIPPLAYDRPGRQTAAETVALAIVQSLERRWPGGPDIVHVHNPTLAKNRGLQAILKSLQQFGLRLLCQIHDFAEDGRPAIFFSDSYVADCHYAVLNQRDYNLLRSSGLVEAGLHLLPNPIVPLRKPSPDHPPFRGDAVLYPVRAIRRKNIGEALLVSRYFNPPAALSVTLPPNSLVDRLSYDRWRSFAGESGLDVRFEVGLTAALSTLMAGCRYVLTTSIAEGFGFVFLEPWTAECGVWGRLLPDICADFIQRGLRLDGFYERLGVPLDFFDHADLCRRWQSARLSAFQRFGMLSDAEAVQKNWREIVSEGTIDFGLLDETAQQQVIRRIMRNRVDFQRLKRLNLFLERPEPPEAIEALVSHNHRAVARHYSQERYTKRLHDVYKSIITTGTVRHAIDKKVLIKAFLAPHTFSLLKWGSIDAAL